MNPTEFFTLLWGAQPPGVLQLWEMKTKRSAYLSGYGPGSAIEDVLDGATDVYAAVGLDSVGRPPSQRTKIIDVVAIAGLWLDIDIDVPGRKTDGVPTMDAAVELANAFLAPTLTVNSGYGLHAYYLFESGPWRFEDERDNPAAALMSWQFHALTRKYAECFGWSLGGTHDLSRLLRIPGTLNGKRSPAVPVEVVQSDGPRYSRRELARLCARAGRPAERPPLQDIGELDLGAVEDMPEWVERLLRDARGVRMAFAHEPANASYSTSNWDLALATRAAEEKLGLTDAQLAELIVVHRNRCPGAKALREKKRSYLSDTVAKARARTR